MTEYTQLEREKETDRQTMNICSMIIQADNAHAHNSKLSGQDEYD